MESESKKILEMIENLSLDDEVALNEIDARVWVFLELSNEFEITFSGATVYYRHKSWPSGARTIMHHPFQHPQYTRSRDALKSVRPDGWAFAIWSNVSCAKWVCGISKDSDNLMTSVSLPSEELAELHAIIQAKQWERQNVQTR